MDPASSDVLTVELTAPARSRRLRGLQVIQAIRIAKKLEEPIIELLADEDHIVRAEGARTLKFCKTARAANALNQARADHSVTVQEAAVESLRLMTRQVVGHTSQIYREENVV